MKVYVLTSEALIGGVIFPKMPKVFKRRGDARRMLRRILDEEVIPEYIDIRGYITTKDNEDEFSASLMGSVVWLSINEVEME